MNTQPIQKREFNKDGILQVHSIFRTIQGEGPFTGTPAVFIRLAGCNLQCPACDTDYTSETWPSSTDNLVTLIKKQAPSGLVVITGGEPFRQNIEPLLYKLVSHGYYVQIESNGTLQPAPVYYSRVAHHRSGVYLVCSPKAGKIQRDVRHNACCFKYVLSHDSMLEVDGLPARALDHPCAPFVARPPYGVDVYLQPMDSGDPETNRKNLNAVIKSCMKHGYILQLQVHKLLNME